MMPAFARLPDICAAIAAAFVSFSYCVVGHASVDVNSSFTYSATSWPGELGSGGAEGGGILGGVDGGGGGLGGGGDAEANAVVGTTD